MIHLLDTFNKFFTLYFVFPFLAVMGIYFTIRLRGVQISKLKMGFATLFDKKSGGEGDISHYQAVASVLASNFGTGNISGMAVALATGGPGALVWMWIMSFFGSAIQFANCLLGVEYRIKKTNGEYEGGPMYYLANGLRLKGLAIFFSIAVIFAVFCAGGFVQCNSLALPLAKMGISPWITGVVVAFFVGLVVVGGARRIAHMCGAVVPIMAILYLGSALFILVSFKAEVIPAIALVFKSAFSGTSLFGGALGFTVMKALTTGFNRAIFATDAGTGTVPLLQSNAKTTHPVVDGVISLVAPFLVMIVCTATVLVLIVTGAFGQEGLASTNMVTHAFEIGLGGKIGTYVVLLALVLFGYTTIVAWAACLDRVVYYLFGDRFIKLFQIIYIASIPLGAILHVDVVWIIADIALTMMMVVNLIGVMGLSKEVVFDYKDFFSTKTQVKSDA